MIIAEDKASTKVVEIEANRSPHAPVDDPPPSYAPPTEFSVPSGSGIASSSNESQIIYPPDIKPSNFISLSRPNSSVKGTWLIDPALYIPPSFLPPLPAEDTEETRKHVSLASKNGGVDADIFIVPSSTTETQATPRPDPTRVFIHATSHNGSVIIRIHEITPKSNQEKRLPLQITSTSWNGRVTVYLPRSFQGPVHAKTGNGSLHISDKIQPTLTQFSDLDNIQRCFIGAFEPSKWEEGRRWEGDELFVESKNGNIKLHFLDELNVPATPTAEGGASRGFFSRLFRLD